MERIEKRQAYQPDYGGHRGWRNKPQSRCSLHVGDKIKGAGPVTGLDSRIQALGFFGVSQTGGELKITRVTAAQHCSCRSE